MNSASTCGRTTFRFLPSDVRNLELIVLWGNYQAFLPPSLPVSSYHRRPFRGNSRYETL